VEAIIERTKPPVPPGEVIHLLLWYGFLGIADGQGRPIYIYDWNYDIRRVDAERTRQGSDLLYVINPAFMRGL
jgi:hypothetical protein